MTSLDLRNVRAIVTDADVLGGIEPAAVAAYLTRTRWVRAHERTGAAIWTRWIGDYAAKLLVPYDLTFGDYAIRMSEVLAALALAEDRSQLAVLVDLCGASHSGGARMGEQASAMVDVEALRRLLEKATPRPWKVDDLLDPAVSAFAEGARGCREDAELAAAAVNALPSLLDELEKESAETERLHSWAGLVSLLDDHYPADVFDGTSADSDARLVVLVRALDATRRRVRRLGAALEDLVEAVEENCDPDDPDIDAALQGAHAELAAAPVEGGDEDRARPKAMR